MAELTQENLNRLKELVGYDHDGMGPWSVRDLQNHASWLLAAHQERGREIERLHSEQTCIDIWLRRREPVTHESATLRSVQEFIKRAEAKLAEAQVRYNKDVASHYRVIESMQRDAKVREAKLAEAQRCTQVALDRERGEQSRRYEWQDRATAAEAREAKLREVLAYVIEVREIKCQHSHPAPDASCAKCRSDAALAASPVPPDSVQEVKRG